MKVKILDAHDKLLEVHKQKDYITQGYEECVRNRPEQFGNRPFYVFAHNRTIQPDEKIQIFLDEMGKQILDPLYTAKYKSIEDVPSGRLLWIPRLTKPIPQENSMLFKAYPGTDTVQTIWILPPIAMWDQYEKGNMLEHETVRRSIHRFKNDFANLSASEADDLTEEQAKDVMQSIARDVKWKREVQKTNSLSSAKLNV